MTETGGAERIATALACGRAGCPCGRRQGKEWITHCPAHNDTRPSLSLRDRDDGLPLVHCLSGCSQDAVIDALRGRSLWPDRNSPAIQEPKTSAPEAEYHYCGEAGEPVAIKGRFRKENGDKSFAWRRPDSDGWKGLGGLKESQLPLYNAHLLLTADGPIVIVEGEKAADACLDAGLLAVCSPGGAATKAFGDQLTALAGRNVILWPDNDGEGRALMQRISIRLQGIAASVRTVALEVPPRGDAWDFFNAGGTKEALLAEADKIRTAPWIEETATGYLVGIPNSGGAAMFRFDNLEDRPHILQADVTAWVEIPGMAQEPFSGRLNILSLSHRDAFRRQLTDVIPLEKGVWTQLLSRACSMVAQARAEADPSIDLTILENIHVAARYRIKPFALDDGPTILFGPGGSGKTFLSLALAACTAKGRDFLGQPCLPGGVLFVDFESTAERIKARLLRILAGMNLEWGDLPFIYWPGRGRPLPEMIPALKRKVGETDTRFVVVDSAALAVGAEPEKAETAIRYFNALATLEIPSLTIAHVTKGEEDQYPFGSIFWNNSARLTWNLKAVHEDVSPVAHLGLFNRKANEERPHPPIGIRVDFGPDDVRFSREELRAGIDDRANLAQRIRSAVRSGAKTPQELEEAIGARENEIRARLSTMPDMTTVRTRTSGAKEWGLKGEN